MVQYVTVLFTPVHLTYYQVGLLLLLCLCGSTNGVYPSGLRDCGEDDEMGLYATKLDDGYSQSKWVAEQLVRRAMDRGLPATIYRLGTTNIHISLHY